MLVFFLIKLINGLLEFNSESGTLCGLSGSLLVKIGFVRNMVYGASTVLIAGLATLHKDRFIERQLGTTALPQDWNGTVLAY